MITTFLHYEGAWHDKSHISLVPHCPGQHVVGKIRASSRTARYHFQIRDLVSFYLFLGSYVPQSWLYTTEQHAKNPVSVRTSTNASTKTRALYRNWGTLPSSSMGIRKCQYRNWLTPIVELGSHAESPVPVRASTNASTRTGRVLYQK